MLNLLLQYLRSWSHRVFALFLLFSLFPFLFSFFTVPVCFCLFGLGDFYCSVIKFIESFFCPLHSAVEFIHEFFTLVVYFKFKKKSIQLFFISSTSLLRLSIFSFASFLCNPSPKTFFWWLHYNLYQIIPTAIPSQWWYPLILFSYSNWDFPHSCYELWFSIIPWLFGVLCFEIQAFV